MVSIGLNTRRRDSGALMTEVVVAMAILTIAMMPLAYTFSSEQKVLKNAYQRGVAMELVDGEMEILMAGEWRGFKEGTQPYEFQGASATNLPPGKATLTITGKHLRLEWRPAKQRTGGAVAREADVK
jgi:hypothetical protein